MAKNNAESSTKHFPQLSFAGVVALQSPHWKVLDDWKDEIKKSIDEQEDNARR